jgi:hypothetical protein
MTISMRLSLSLPCPESVQLLDVAGLERVDALAFVLLSCSVVECTEEREQVAPALHDRLLGLTAGLVQVSDARPLVPGRFVERVALGAAVVVEYEGQPLAFSQPPKSCSETRRTTFTSCPIALRQLRSPFSTWPRR